MKDKYSLLIKHQTKVYVELHENMFIGTKKNRKEKHKKRYIDW